MQRSHDGQNLRPHDGIIDRRSFAAGFDESVGPEPHELLRHRDLPDPELLAQFGDRLFPVHQGAQHQQALRVGEAAHQYGGRLGGRDHFYYIHVLEFIILECYMQARNARRAQIARGHSGMPGFRPLKQKETIMTIDRAVLLFAGLMVLVSLGLGFYVSPWWYLLTAFVGLNLIQASVTGFCPAAMVFRKFGCPAGIAFK